MIDYGIMPRSAKDNLKIMQSLLPLPIPTLKGEGGEILWESYQI